MAKLTPPILYQHSHLFACIIHAAIISSDKSLDIALQINMWGAGALATGRVLPVIKAILFVLSIALYKSHSCSIFGQQTHREFPITKTIFNWIRYWFLVTQLIRIFQRYMDDWNTRKMVSSLLSPISLLW